MDASIQSNIDQFNTAFAEYVAWTSKTPQEALEHKVKNIGINLFHGFRAHEFGGYPRQRGVALNELHARTAEKRGTRIRSALLAQYEGQRDTLRKEARDLKKQRRNFMGTLNDWVGMSSAIAANAVKRIGAWHDIVGKETKLRQSGIGELGAAFLWYRNRGKGENRHVVLNRTGKPMGEVTVSDGVALIVGQVAGLNTVDSRYGIVAQAIGDETDDTLSWIKEQQDQAGARIMGALVS